ncbi:MAG: Abi family protein, partial [Bacteroidales bacterium]|nr:Abi family protein [Bacteroidales bacterium]
MSAKKIGSLTVDEQIDLLSERGMLFRDPDKAKNALCRIGYFHLKGYWWDMMLEADKHHFRDNSYFEEVIERYHFDQHLRSILFDAL